MSTYERCSIEELQALCNEKTLVDAQFIRRNSGGYAAILLGHTAFLPGSHSLVPSTVPIEQDTLLNSTASVVIIEVRTEPLKLVISRREAKTIILAQAAADKEIRKAAKEAADAELAAIRSEEFAGVDVGDIIEATELYNRPGYVILEFDNLRVRIQKTELGWGDLDFPSAGATITCEVVSKNSELLALEASIKRTLPDPWVGITDRYQHHPPQLALVKNIAKFGVFAEIEPGVECLLHRSLIPNIGAETVLSEHFAKGDQIPIAIESIYVESRRIGIQLATTLSHWDTIRAVQGQLRASQVQSAESEIRINELIQQLSVVEEKALQNEAYHEEIQNQLSNQKILLEQGEVRTRELTEGNDRLRTQSKQLEAEFEKKIQLLQKQHESEVRVSKEENQVQMSRLNKWLAQARNQIEALEHEKEELKEDLNTARSKIVQQQVKLKSLESKANSSSELQPPKKSEPTSQLKSVVVSKVDDPNAVFITFSNSKQLTSSVDINHDTIAGKVFSTEFPDFNRLEQQQLLAYQQLCQFPEQYLSSAAKRVLKARGNMLFASTPPAFHRTPKCQFALSDYINYEVPEEIKKAGKEIPFREWWAARFEENPKYRDSPQLMESLLTRCKLHFKLSTLPRQFIAPNGGVVQFTSQDAKMLETQIESLIAEAAAFVNSSPDHRTILRLNGKHAYKGGNTKHSVDNPTKLSDEEVRAILKRYENDYKKVLITLLQTYYRSKYNSALSFDHSLLIAFGFRPCHGCFGSSASQFLSQSVSAPPIASDDDNDLPF